MVFSVRVLCLLGYKLVDKQIPAVLLNLFISSNSFSVQVLEQFLSTRPPGLCLRTERVPLLPFRPEALHVFHLPRCFSSTCRSELERSGDGGPPCPPAPELRGKLSALTAELRVSWGFSRTAFVVSREFLSRPRLQCSLSFRWRSGDCSAARSPGWLSVPSCLLFGELALTVGFSGH